jgi:carboxypeptidase D
MTCQAYVLLREFILGSNKTGLYIHGGPTTTALGPTATLEGPAKDLLRGGDAIFTGSYTTQGSVVAPSQTIAAWNSFIATRWSSASVPSAT